MFDYTSRYAALPTAVYTRPDGTEAPYKRRRFLPQPESLQKLTDVEVTEGDQPDLIAARTLGAPEQFWRIHDANRKLEPFDLTAPDQIGQRLTIPMPQAGQ